MKTYKELKDNFFEEVGKIDVGKLFLGGFGNTLKEYAELLKTMSEIPEKTKDEILKDSMENASYIGGFGGLETPKIEEGGK